MKKTKQKYQQRSERPHTPCQSSNDIGVKVGVNAFAVKNVKRTCIRKRDNKELSKQAGGSMLIAINAAELIAYYL